MANVYEVEPKKYNIELANALKEIPEFGMPEWAYFVKTGSGKERPPRENDWWYRRSASILRQAYVKGVVGVNKLRVKYGNKKDKGHKRDKFRKASGKVIRTILQQGEKSGFLQKSAGKKKGRELTKEGLKFLNDVSEEIIKKENSEMGKNTE